MEKQRKIKILALIAMAAAVLGLTVAFAFISTTLKINGSATFTGAAWDIHFDNLSEAKITGDAKEVTRPQITDGGITINNLNVSLLKPMDKIVYTVDVVNSGKMTAEITSISMTQLTPEQAKYIKFEAKYSNGNYISEKDVLKPEQKETVIITIEYKKEITVDQAPKEPLVIDLSLTINYAQSDDVGGDVPPTTTEPSDKTYLVGETISLGDEHFYVISDNGDTVTAISYYLIGVEESPKQVHGGSTIKSIAFSTSGYWKDQDKNLLPQYGANYPAFVYDSNSKIYSYVQAYQAYLISLGYESVEATLMSYEQAIALGCSGSSCAGAPSWLRNNVIWLGSASNYYTLWTIDTSSNFKARSYTGTGGMIPGMRPVITIDKSEL